MVSRDLRTVNDSSDAFRAYEMCVLACNHFGYVKSTWSTIEDRVKEIFGFTSSFKVLGKILSSYGFYSRARGCAV